MNEESSERVEISIDLDPRIHFSMQQNDVPVVKSLRIENRGEVPLRDLEVLISAEPGFAQSWGTRIAAIGPQAVYNLDAVDLQLAPGFLWELTERVRGQLRAELRCEGEVMAGCTVSVELLARDEWGGLSTLPEILAAFVLPNHPEVERVLRTAAEILSHWTSDPSLQGYQTGDPWRVYKMTAAVYAALQNQGLTYVNPPASFEEEGQRIRLPDRIVSSRMATCLDVALFTAACLEQAGLNALIVLVRGHAFTGVWLRDECFPEPAVDDGLRLRKRVDLSELAVFDATGVTSRPPVPFDRSVAEAKRWLDGEDSFLCAIDVKRARKGQIRPLPERVSSAENTVQAEMDDDMHWRDPAAPDVSGLTLPPEPAATESEPAAETSATRLDRWCRRLLDLSLRNRLLNFKDTKKTLRLLCPDLDQLEDMLAGGATFQIRPRPADFAENDPRDSDAHRRSTGQEGLDELLREELKGRRLHADNTSEELERRLIEIYRGARVGLEEGGASALYLAIGYLAWYETEKSEVQRLAPILLLPVELHRQSVRERFSLRLGNDEPRINVTLLEMLKQDHGIVIPGLDPLPEDESGLGVAQILRTVRQSVRDIDRWDVRDEAWIGFFSFTKFLMWRDLNERAAVLMQNSVVEHLVNRPDQPFEPDASFPRPERLDEERAPTETFCPLPADSSQLAAVFAAAEGRSFVLEGPPGTGKSQTIANIVAHCLTEGKTVLFVSEKMAALNVVYRRLQNVGLGRYCFELHSNKAHKLGVIGQLERALERFEGPDGEEWESEARRLAELRKELNAYVEALHQKRSTGETVFRATSRLVGLRDMPRVDLRWATPDALDADALGALRDLVQRMATAGAACGKLQAHTFEGVRKADWTPGWEEEVRGVTEALRASVETLGDRAGRCSEKLGLGYTGSSMDEFALLRELTLTLVDPPAAPIPILVRPDWDTIQNKIGIWIQRGRTRDRLRAEVQEDFGAEIIDLDLDGLRTRLKHASLSSWPASWWRLRPVRKALKSVALDGKAPPKEDLTEILDRTYTLREEQRKLDSALDEAQTLLGCYWRDGAADWDEIEKVLEWAQQLRALSLRASSDNLEHVSALRERWARFVCEGRDLLQKEGKLVREFVSYGEAFDEFRRARNRMSELLDLDIERVWGEESAQDALGRVRSSTVAWETGTHKLREWCAWLRVRAEAMRSNLAPLVEAYEQGQIESDQLDGVFERSYSQWWIAAITDREPVLSRFFSPEHERKIKQFREVDDRYMALTRQLIQARLDEQVPATNATISNSEMGVVMRELKKKRRHMSVRQLLQRIPNLLPRLTPCLLMSPMSIAQYLDASYPPFDLVVFDEASQIPVWDAVGAIARGRQAVIVGDPKQLPPTTFFQREGEEDDEAVEEGVVDDLESILDDCIGARIPWLTLDWHYRSRHESLIAFSNYHYYGNRLLTFPSPALEGMGVRWNHVAHGAYDRGKTRTNRAEAEAVVQEILRRLRNPELVQYSIGVVTFSQAQQNLIEDLLDAARLDDHELDYHFIEEKEEPIFVKNLENVQGDERDVILFSICYGPDTLGRVSMNFGPMNRDGGERRLNVAITRARREVIVFSTLKAEHIDLSRTRARGARDLKGFLEYAERGPAAIAEAVQVDPDADFDSPFEEAVFEALVQRGWDVHKQVGCARYRIDLAVVDPNAPGRYLIGIECDGATYHRAKTARDRDKLRESVLRDLGWRLHRIWSTDWWTDPAKEIGKQETAVEQAREEAREQVRDEDVNEESDGQAADVASSPERVTFAAAPARTNGPRAPDPPLQRYQSIEASNIYGFQADLYERRAEKSIRERLIEVVRQEGPISLSLAARRVAECWGFERVRSKALKRIRQLVPAEEVIIRSTAAGEFLWPIELDPENYSSFRVPDANGDGMRKAPDLPVEEIANAVLHLLRQNMSCPCDELVRETGRLFGFDRVGQVIADRIHGAIDSLAERGIIESKNGTITLLRQRSA